MNAFHDAQKVEMRSMKILRPFIQQRAFNGQFVLTSKGPLAKELQCTVGDALYNADPDTVYSVEVKAEEENKYGNLFLETWSNLSRFKPGWMVTLQADLLLYHFLQSDELFVIEYQKLKSWAFRERRIYSFPERAQSKRAQLNDTWGRCVPIETIEKEVGLQRFQPSRASSVETAGRAVHCSTVGSGTEQPWS